MGKWKKLKKTANKTVDKAEDVAKDAGKVVDDASKSVGKSAGKSVGKQYNAATGALVGDLDEAFDYNPGEYKSAVKYAGKKFKQGADWIEDLAQDAIQAAYQDAYRKYLEEYIEIVLLLGEATHEICKSPDNVIGGLRDVLVDGEFSEAETGLLEMLDHKLVQKAIVKGHKMFGTCFIMAVDVSVGLSGSHVAVGGGGSVGVVQLLDNHVRHKYKSAVFTAGGFSAGLTTSKDPSLGVEVGVSMGFLSKDPTNIKGWFVDGCGSGSFEHGSYGLTLSWAPPSKKAPYVYPAPVAGVCRFALGKGTGKYTGPDITATIGASYTKIIQKIKSEVYEG
ncbi:hypothetical protein DB30_00552 [Enhygromyxa salina]|uniref:Uncharacterized protein n=1 Tax=Enhygromyxa salina TaxID=215803 RepID=A0A0C2CYZ4_9BACT|nr:hypothetical protein [Enhygromyxa salina]KIG13087.1 hypothetical protein DB30_00552 [Enhygromyxa salina]